MNTTHPVGHRTSQDRGRKPSTSLPPRGCSTGYPTPMMFLRSGDGEDLDRRRRLFAALAPVQLWTNSSMVLIHTVRQIRYRVDEFSGPSGNDEVLFTEAARERGRAVSGEPVRVIPSETKTTYLNCAVRPPKTGTCGVERYGIESTILARSCCRLSLGCEACL
jgi:hypothetical protein